MLRRIISLYKKAHAEIERSNSGRSKYYLILSFFTECEKTFNALPPFTLIKDFVSILIDIILKSDINFTDPAKLNATKYILKDSKKEYIRVKGGEVILAQIDKAIDILNMQMLKSYFYLGKYDDGLIVLNNMLNERDSVFNKDEVIQENKKKKEYNRTQTNKYALVNPDIFKESRAYEILTEIKNEIERLNSFSDTHANILLVEQDGLDVSNSSGTIQSLLCSTEKKKTKDDKIVFENITDLEDCSLENTLNDVTTAANSLVKFLSQKNVSTNTKRNIRFENIKVIYRGSSFGFGAAVLCACNYFNYTNSRRRYKINNAAAFTGTIDSAGKVMKVNSQSIKNKIEAAFFSWVKYCVVPKENLNEAREAYENLRMMYPTKEMFIIGVENAADVFEHKDLFTADDLSFINYSRLLVNKYKFASAALLVLFSSLIVFFLATKFLPKDVKPLPKTESDMSLIYAPDRDTNWIFKNNNYSGGDTINFGDVAIGDQWFPLIEFWNNGRKGEKFNVFIDGKDKEEFALTWMYNNEQPGAPEIIKEDFLQQLYVKFVPVKSEGNKNAVLVFENTESKSRKEIYLKGVSKRLNKGYCIDINEIENALVLEPSENLIKDNCTISFWIKPYYIDPKEDSFLFTVENNPLTNNKLGITIKGSDSIIYLTLNGSKSTEIPLSIISTETKFNTNNWNYFAMSVKDTNLIVVVNETRKRFRVPQNTLRKFNDYIYFGALRPAERVNPSAEYFVCKYYLDEFKIFNKALSTEELIMNKTEMNYQKENLLVHCSFEDANPRRFFDNSTNDFWPKNYGGIRRVIDNSQPFNNVTKNVDVDKSRNVVFCRYNKGFLKLNKNLYLPKSSFTLQCDLKVEKDKTGSVPTLFPTPYYINRAGLDINLDTEDDSSYVRLLNNYKNQIYFKKFKVSSPYEWNKYTICYDFERNEYNFYINETLVLKLNNVDIQDITQNYMGISFGLANYYGSPRYSSIKSFVDNIKLFNRSLEPSEILSQTKNGLIAFWNFENTDKELAYDEISHLPLLMIEPFELVNEEVLINHQ